MGKLYSTDKIMTYVGNSEENCKELLKLFADTIPGELDKLKAEITNKNWAKAYEILHRIKPSFEIMEIKGGSDDFIKLNNNISLKMNLDKSWELFNNMKKHINNAIEEILEDIAND